MLELMRKRARSTWIKVVFGMIIAVFVLWGVGGSLGGGQTDTVVAVNGRDISVREFQRAYENLYAGYQRVYKDRLTSEILESLNLRQQAVEQLVNTHLMEQEARRIGFVASDEEVRKAISTLPVFQTEGQFSQAQYLRALRFLRTTPSEFEDEQRMQLLTQKLQRIFTDAVQATDAEVRDLFQLNQEKVSLSFIKIAAADLLHEVTSTSEEVKVFYDTHRESFRQPERVKFAYVAYPASHFASEVKITDSEVEAFYADHKEDRFTTPARIHARHILFSFQSDASEQEKEATRGEAAEVLARIRAGEDFAMLAKTYSHDTATASEGGDLGWFTRGRMVKPFEDAAFSLSAGNISDLIETIFGLHIIKIEEKEEARVRPLAEVEQDIRQELTQPRARERARTNAWGDREQIQTGTAMNAVAQARGLTVGKAPFVARDETVGELGQVPALTEAALGLPLEKVSEPISVEDTWYLVSPQEKAPSVIPDFSAVAEEAEQRLKSEKAETLAKEKADALLARVQETGNLTGIAEAQDLKVQETGPFTRQGGYIPQIGSVPELKRAAFRLSNEAPVASRTYAWGDNVFVVVLKERIPPSPVEFDNRKEDIRQELQRRKEAEAINELLRYLQERATITYNQNVLNASS